MAPAAFQPIVPAIPAFRADGTLISERFGDVYASSAGTLAETRHVFLSGNGLPERWMSTDRFTVVETGFGAGLNFLTAWQAWRETAAARARLNFVSVEKHPFVRADLERIHARYPEFADAAAEMRRQYPPLLPGFHRLHFEGGRVTLTLLFGDAADMLSKLDACADAFFLDGFAPGKNPEMWSSAVFAQMSRLAVRGATLATYTVAGAVRQGLAAAGFAVEKCRGFGSKREMLVGRHENGVAPDGASPDRRAAVIGAGLAGTACAQRLAERGWDVTVVERGAEPALAASGNPAGLVRPVFSLDWNLHSRFTTASCLYAMRHQQALRRGGHPILQGEGGVLQLARDASNFAKQQQIVERFSLPGDLVRMVSTEEASAVAGVRVAGPGWWFPDAAWAGPASVCRANLAAHESRVRCHFDTPVHELRHGDEGWEILGPSREVIAAAPVVILANAHQATQFSQAAWLPLRPVRGQISLVPARIGSALRIGVCRDGYVTPAISGIHCVGATFDEGVSDEKERREDHESNLLRLEEMLPGFGEGVSAEELHGRVAFRAMATDRLPVLGDVPSGTGSVLAGLYGCLALGSRGMTWGALAAEIVASRIVGDPMPVERDLLRALEAKRFLARGRKPPT